MVEFVNHWVCITIGNVTLGCDSKTWPDRDSDRRFERASTYSSVAALAAAALAPVLVLALAPGQWLPFLLGMASWALGLAAKLVLNRPRAVKKLMRGSLSGSAAWGAISGISELGMLWLCFAALDVPATALAGAIAGVGAASLEVYYIIGEGIRHRNAPDQEKQQRIWLRGARYSGLVRHMFLIERVLAGGIHIGTRALFLGGIERGLPLASAAAILTFVAVDGTATYGVGRRWNWCAPRTARRFYSLLALASALALGAAGLLLI